MSRPFIPLVPVGSGMPTERSHYSPSPTHEAEASSHRDLHPSLSILPRATSMDVQNDPRFISNNVIAKRLAAFQTICVVSVLMVNLSVKQMFLLEKAHVGPIQFVGFFMMTVVFLLNLATVVILIQQLFMTYRLLTAGPTGFEIAKAYYLNPNIVAMRHSAVKGFFFSLPLFVASTSCMVWVAFIKDKEADGQRRMMVMPVLVMLCIAAIILWCVNIKHASLFKEQYKIAKAYEAPLLTHVEQNVNTTQTSSYGGVSRFLGLDV